MKVGSSQGQNGLEGVRVDLAPLSKLSSFNLQLEAVQLGSNITLWCLQAHTLLQQSLLA